CRGCPCCGWCGCCGRRGWRCHEAAFCALKRRMGRLLALAAMVCIGSGCTATARYRLEAKELGGLDGYDAKNERTMMATVPTTYMVGKTMVSGVAAVPELVTDMPYRLIHPSGRGFDFNSRLN